MDERLEALSTLSKEKRELVAKLLTEHPRFAGKAIIFRELEEETTQKLGRRIPEETIRRVFHGGHLPYETRSDNKTPGQAKAIIALFELLGLDLAAVLPEPVKLTQLPLTASHTGRSGISISLETAGFSLSKAKAAIAALRAAGLPIGEAKAAILRELGREIGLD